MTDGALPASEADGRGATVESVAGPYTFDDVSVVMGTFNEVDAIETVLADVASATGGRAEVICVDGSEDGTADVARSLGAAVVEQRPRGYGVALEAGLRTAARAVVVTTDCDDTYPMSHLPSFLEAINDGFDVVGGDRLTDGADAMPRVNQFGNRALSTLATSLAGRRVRDVTTGMRAYRCEVVEAIAWTENTGLSAELLLRPLLRGYRVTEIPIPYGERTGETTLDPLRGGAAIGASIVRVCAEEWRRRLGRSRTRRRS